ncbi:hypothetical protein [Rhodoferax sp.]|uniref:hypothetical protein n=1 Tax=Rhodoferax sp. TaxID=50421 RepID=UPI00374D3CC5
MHKPKVCLFCGRGAPEVKISGEHVLRAKLQEHFPKQDTTTLLHRYQSDEGVKYRSLRIPQGPFTSVVNEVCKPCNEGWLNLELEIPVEPVLVSLIHGKALRLEVNDLRLLSLWAAKTASIRALMVPGPRSIPPEHYRQMMDLREPPEGTHVWMANSVRDWSAFTRHARIALPAGDGTCSIHLSTIILGGLSFFVAGFHPSWSAELFDEMFLRLDSNALKIWPFPVSSDWPTGELTFEQALNLSNMVPPRGYLISPGSVEMFDL